MAWFPLGGWMNIYAYQNRARTHLFVETEIGVGEVSPLEGWSEENTDQALCQLKALKSGWKGSLYPSVAFGFASAQRPINEPFKVPAALLFMGSKEEILQQAENGRDFQYAKIKLRQLSVSEAVDVVQQLKSHFRLRIDFNQAWDCSELLEFCSHFCAEDVEFLEDPPIELENFATASDQVARPNRLTVWKPTVKGIPKDNQIILSSSFEMGVGIAHIGRLALEFKTVQPIGVGTYKFLAQDVLKEPLHLRNGYLWVPS